MKKIMEKVMLEALKRLMSVLLDALEKMLNADLDGDGKIGKDDEPEA